MTSRERIVAALSHREADKIPFDLGGSAVTGMQASTVYRLRQALALDPPGTPVRVIEPYQMLGEIAGDLMDAIGIDVVCLWGRKTMFGFENSGWKEWKLFDGTPVLVPSGFNTLPEPNGDILLYPEGDRSLAPSGRMPGGGYYVDAIVRQQPIDDATLNVEDNLQEFTAIADEDLDHFRREAERLYTQTDKALLASFGGTAFGDIALVPAMWLRDPRGIRDIEEWYVSTVSRKEFVRQVFEKQCEIALGNLAKLHAAVGDRVVAAFTTGTDFGTQCGPFISRKTYRELYQPFHREVNAWIHRHTGWKSFIHSCGSVYGLIPDFIESGFDILNPVQCSAADMDPARLKAEFGKALTFWGGGVDTQQTLPFGTPAEVAEEVKTRIAKFGPGGGFVFNAIHNVQAGVPIANLMALVETFDRYRAY
ncbi:MAG TPA: uroporphyrinogen decarboxylase family protein [Bacteroidota bacterium]|nr:uroporphyrinogen decarboxylase family protein [Bacteroidota bacterium]